MTIARIIEPAAAALDHTLASHRRATLWLVIVSLALFLPGFFTMQPMDRDEPRFAQATKQMLETGDLVAIRFQDEARNKKPVGIYWMQAAIVGAADALGLPQARTTIWLYRLVSLLGAASAVLLTYWTALAFVSRRNAFLAALLLASTVLLGVEARLAKTDAVILATVVGAMGALARFYFASKEPSGSDETSGKSLFLPFVFWTSIGLGLLIKGPITPMIAAFTVIALAIKDRSGRWLGATRPLPGLFWALALVVPWFILIMIATKGAFLADSVGADMLSKVGSGQESHGAPPGTYLAVFWATAWPMAPFVALAAPFAWAARKDPKVAFLLAWIVPAWILFEIVPTKLPHYVLPVYPALAILVALAAERGALAMDRKWSRPVLLMVPGLAFLLLVAGIGLAVWGQRLPGTATFAVMPFLLWLGLHLLRDIGRENLETSIIGGAALAGMTYVLIFSGILTSGPFDPFRLSPRLTESARLIAATLPNCPRLAPATVGYREPSLVFLTGTDLFMTDGAGAARFLDEAPCRIAFVEKRQEDAFKAALATDSTVSMADRISGINLNGGRNLDLGVYARRGPLR
ncbi:MAG: glycosyltransferase family 39 protein [Beijerinckiaceae bacterium]|jgi:4-amino-4-deoxy-L-arabinose transferase-like glycosyltransferase|nr:glycosyltransferase family 39 protein [Beijerinckiaceae bacterium]